MLLPEVLLVAIILLVSDSEANSRSSYGEACSKFQRCNQRQFLNCANGHFCDCIKPTTMIFDELLNKCAKLVGVQCSETSDITSDRHFNLINNTPCVSNSECKEHCKCSHGYFPTSHGTCEVRRDYGATCSNDEMCRVGLICSSDHKCICQSNKFYSAVFKTCVKSLGEPCLHDDDCPELAICDPKNNFTCSCTSPRYIQAANNTCVLAISEEDSSSIKPLSPPFQEPCSPGLIRRNGSCECIFKDHQEYLGTEQQRCHSLVYGPCNITSDCIPEAECSVERGLQLCLCKAGFNPVDRRCELAFGEDCVQTPQKCDKLGPLECNSDGKCDCSDFQTYNNQSLKCQGLLGAKCDTKLLKFCSEGTFCKPFRGFKTEFGVCTCLPDLQGQANRTCA